MTSGWNGDNDYGREDEERAFTVRVKDSEQMRRAHRPSKRGAEAFRKDRVRLKNVPSAQRRR